MSSKNYRDYATRETTPTMKAFGDWILAEVYGGELPENLDPVTFYRSVALGGSLRMDFQKSDFWRNDERNYLANVESNREAKAIQAAAKAKETARKAVERAKAAEAKAVEAAKAAKAKAEALAAKAEEAAA